MGVDNGYAHGALFRLDEDGTRDLGFDVNLAALARWAVRGVNALVVLPSGQILVGGTETFTENDVGLLVLDQDGQVASNQISLVVGEGPVLSGAVGSIVWQDQSLVRPSRRNATITDPASKPTSQQVCQQTSWLADRLKNNNALLRESLHAC